MTVAPADRVVVIGAGMGGLASAIMLASAGVEVTVIEAHGTPGGKMRTVPSAAGPVDAGPTVLTMRPVFERLFQSAGAQLDDHVKLIPQPLLARHWWPDGGQLDLFTDPDQSAAAIRDFAGPRAERQFHRFRKISARLLGAFDGPVIHSSRPSVRGIVANALRSPRLWPSLMPGMTLSRALRATFSDPRLRQLFGRYATYVGGSPYRSPAVLGLIWHAEEQGVWAVKGGMHQLARAMEALARTKGVTFRYNIGANRIVQQFGQVTGVGLSDGSTLDCGQVVFNGDPAALVQGLLGTGPKEAVPPGAVHPRSHSAQVWSFAATPSGPDLAMHNVFFSADPQHEFGPITHGDMPTDPTLYICAQDRAEGLPKSGPERFEIIMNAPHLHPDAGTQGRKEFDQCQTTTFQSLNRFGLSFDPVPGPEALTSPSGFARMFPGSQGSIYGRSPHGLMAAFQRPGPATRLPGLWLAGGGAHPGAGVPMATLSGMNAGRAVIAHLNSTSKSRQTAMPGGTSTVSRMTAAGPSRSLGS